MAEIPADRGGPYSPQILHHTRDSTFAEIYFKKYIFIKDHISECNAHESEKSFTKPASDKIPTSVSADSLGAEWWVAPERRNAPTCGSSGLGETQYTDKTDRAKEEVHREGPSRFTLVQLCQARIKL